MLHRGLLSLVLVLGLVATLSCGGGGSRDDSADITFNATPIGGFDGWIQGGPIVIAQANGVNAVQVGEWYAGALGTHELRGYFTFDLTGLPGPPARIRAATLEIRQFSTQGTPYPGLGSVVIDHVTLGASFDSTDFDPTVLQAGFATVTDNATVRSIGIDVATQVGNDQVNARPRSSFRIRFTNPMGMNGNVVDDFARFNDAEDHEGAGLVPKLTILYTP